MNFRSRSWFFKYRKAIGFPFAGTCKERIDEDDYLLDNSDPLIVDGATRIDAARSTSTKAMRWSTTATRSSRGSTKVSTSTTRPSTLAGLRGGQRCLREGARYHTTNDARWTEVNTGDVFAADATLCVRPALPPSRARQVGVTAPRGEAPSR